MGAIAAGRGASPAWMQAVNAQAERGCAAPRKPLPSARRAWLTCRESSTIQHSKRARGGIARRRMRSRSCEREHRACCEFVRILQHRKTQTEIRYPRFIGSEPHEHDGKIKRVAPPPSLHS